MMEEYEQKMELICCGINTLGDSYDLSEYCSKIKSLTEKKNKLYVDLITTESYRKFNEIRIKKDQEELEHVKKQLNRIVQHLAELWTEKDHFQNNLRNRHNGLKCATQYYKKNLDLYIEIIDITEDKCVVKVYMFSRNMSDRKHWISLLMNDNNTYELLESNPVLSDEQVSLLKAILKETNNVAKVISRVHDIFSKLCCDIVS